MNKDELTKRLQEHHEWVEENIPVINRELANRTLPASLTEESVARRRDLIARARQHNERKNRERERETTSLPTHSAIGTSR